MACLNVTGKTTIPVADEADENASPDRSLHIYKSVSARNLRCNVIYFSVHPKASYDLFPLNSICNGIITFENSLCFRDDERERQKNTYMLYLGIETILSRTLGFFLFVCFFFPRRAFESYTFILAGRFMSFFLTSLQHKEKSSVLRLLWKMFRCLRCKCHI